VTVLTGGSLTVTVALPDFPSAEAVMTMLSPGAIAVTNPLADTDARAGSADDQVKVRASVVPSDAFATALS